MSAPLPKQGEPLSEREEEVLYLLAHGWGNAAIACHLGLSPHTIKHHISRILAKLGVANRTAAAHIAYRTARVE